MMINTAICEIFALLISAIIQPQCYPQYLTVMLVLLASIRIHESGDIIESGVAASMSIYLILVIIVLYDTNGMIFIVLGMNVMTLLTALKK